MKTKYFRLPDKQIIAIDIEDNASVDQTVDKLYEKLSFHTEFKDNYQIKPMDSHFVNDEQLHSWRGSNQQLPIDVVYLTRENVSLFNNSNEIDIKNHYRVWFSNDKDTFIPSFEKVNIEESMKSNPEAISTLIVDKSVLSTKAIVQMEEWSKNTSCAILDIHEIKPSTDSDALILMIVKCEISNWLKEPFIGNPEIASDLIRLLVADKGIYFDCDIFICERLPNKINLTTGGFTNFLSIKHGAINNDVVTFSSDKGRAILEEFKQFALNKYFSGNVPNLENAEQSIYELLYEREKKIRSLSSNQKDDYFSDLVTNIAGPWSLGEFLFEKDSKFKLMNYNLLDLFDCIKRNAKNDFFKNKIKTQEVETKLSWLPSNNTNTQNYNKTEMYLVSYREYLRDIDIDRKRELLQTARLKK